MTHSIAAVCGHLILDWGCRRFACCPASSTLQGSMGTAWVLLSGFLLARLLQTIEARGGYTNRTVSDIRAGAQFVQTSFPDVSLLPAYAYSVKGTSNRTLFYSPNNYTVRAPALLLLLLRPARPITAQPQLCSAVAASCMHACAGHLSRAARLLRGSSSVPALATATAHASAPALRNTDPRRRAGVTILSPAGPCGYLQKRIEVGVWEHKPTMTVRASRQPLICRIMCCLIRRRSRSAWA